MSVVAKALFQNQHIPGANTILYTAPAGTRTIIDKFTACNTSAAPTTVSIYLVPSGQVPATTHNVVLLRTLQPNETYNFPEIVGHILNAGDFILTNATTAPAAAVRISGREVS